MLKPLAEISRIVKDFILKSVLAFIFLFLFCGANSVVEAATRVAISEEASDGTMQEIQILERELEELRKVRDGLQELTEIQKKLDTLRNELREMESRDLRSLKKISFRLMGAMPTPLDAPKLDSLLRNKLTRSRLEILPPDTVFPSLHAVVLPVEDHPECLELRLELLEPAILKRDRSTHVLTSWRKARLIQARNPNEEADLLIKAFDELTDEFIATVDLKTSRIRKHAEARIK